MTLSELKAISDACKTDADFLARPAVRRVYWGCMGQDGPWSHVSCCPPLMDECFKCHAKLPTEEHTDYVTVYEAKTPCHVPDPIPGSLADATEQLRAKVEEKWFDERFLFTNYRIALNSFEQPKSVEDIITSTPRDRFLIFACALGAVEVSNGNV